MSKEFGIRPGVTAEAPRPAHDGDSRAGGLSDLAGFLLTSLLLPKLIANNAKVIQTASQAAKNFGDFDIDDLQNANSYGPLTAYGNGSRSRRGCTDQAHAFGVGVPYTSVGVCR